LSSPNDLNRDPGQAVKLGHSVAAICKIRVLLDQQVNQAQLVKKVFQERLALQENQDNLAKREVYGELPAVADIAHKDLEDPQDLLVPQVELDQLAELAHQAHVALQADLAAPAQLDLLDPLVEMVIRVLKDQVEIQALVEAKALLDPREIVENLEQLAQLELQEEKELMGNQELLDPLDQQVPPETQDSLELQEKGEDLVAQDLMVNIAHAHDELVEPLLLPRQRRPSISSIMLPIFCRIVFLNAFAICSFVEYTYF